jgi:hypothetical protein
MSKTTEQITAQMLTLLDARGALLYTSSTETNSEISREK